MASGNDTDSDRHGIVTPEAGLMNPNHYLAVAIHYLYAIGLAGRGPPPSARPWSSSRIIDRVAAEPGRRLREVPVGSSGSCRACWTGAWASAARRAPGPLPAPDGRVWTTDKDGIILALLAAEITAVTGKTLPSTTGK